MVVLACVVCPGARDRWIRAAQNCETLVMRSVSFHLRCGGDGAPCSSVAGCQVVSVCGCVDAVQSDGSRRCEVLVGGGARRRRTRVGGGRASVRIGLEWSSTLCLWRSRISFLHPAGWSGCVGRPFCNGARAGGVRTAMQMLWILALYELCFSGRRHADMSCGPVHNGACVCAGG